MKQNLNNYTRICHVLMAFFVGFGKCRAYYYDYDLESYIYVGASHMRTLSLNITSMLSKIDFHGDIYFLTKIEDPNLSCFIIYTKYEFRASLVDTR